MTRSAVLVVTAVGAEAAAIEAALGAGRDVELGLVSGRRFATTLGLIDVVVGGVGVAHAAASTASALAGQRYQLVLSAGIAGGFPPSVAGDIIVADEVVHADLGAEDGDIFRPLSELGLDSERATLDPAITTELARRGGGAIGAVLTVSTVTGTATTTRLRLERHPTARAEAMEGAGVLAAAQLAGVPFGEVRAISNAVGPRDRSTWQIPLALRSLGTAIAAVSSAEWDP